MSQYSQMLFRQPDIQHTTLAEGHPNTGNDPFGLKMFKSIENELRYAKL